MSHTELIAKLTKLLECNNSMYAEEGAYKYFHFININCELIIFFVDLTDEGTVIQKTISYQRLLSLFEEWRIKCLEDEEGGGQQQFDDMEIMVQIGEFV